MVHRVIRHFEQFDILINNVGLHGHTTTIVELDLSSWQ